MRTSDADASARLRAEFGFLPKPPCTATQPALSYPAPAALRSQLVERLVVPERNIGVVGQRFAVRLLERSLAELGRADPEAHAAIAGLRMFHYAQVVVDHRCRGGVSAHAWGTAVDVDASGTDTPVIADAIADVLARHGFERARSASCRALHFDLSAEALTAGRRVGLVVPF